MKAVEFYSGIGASLAYSSLTPVEPPQVVYIWHCPAAMCLLPSHMRSTGTKTPVRSTLQILAQESLQRCSMFKFLAMRSSLKADLGGHLNFDRRIPRTDPCISVAPVPRLSTVHRSQSICERRIGSAGKVISASCAERPP